MMSARDGEIRRIAVRIVMAQAATTMLIAAVCALIWGRTHAMSALAGGLIGLIANVFMTLSALRPTASATGALGRLMFGQLLKVAVTVVGLVLVARGGWANWPALLIAYAATLVVFWFVPMWASRPRRVRE